MKKYIFIVLISTTIYSQDIQNNQNLDSLTDIFSLEEVTVNALRAQKGTPVPFVNISTTLAWSKTHFDGFCDPWLLSQSKLLKYDYYLLLNTDVAWIKDDLRDTPNDREKMFLAHKFELDNLNVNYDIIEGSDFNKRLRQAVDYIKKSINFD